MFHIWSYAPIVGVGRSGEVPIDNYTGRYIFSLLLSYTTLKWQTRLFAFVWGVWCVPPSTCSTVDENRVTIRVRTPRLNTGDFSNLLQYS